MFGFCSGEKAHFADREEIGSENVGLSWKALQWRKTTWKSIGLRIRRFLFANLGRGANFALTGRLLPEKGFLKPRRPTRLGKF